MSSLGWSSNWESRVPPRSRPSMVTALAPPSGVDWTIAEQAEIERLKAFCSDRIDLSFECDKTESGDPWVVLYDRTQELTVLHLARIDRRYIAVFSTRSHWTATLRTAVDLALGSIR